MDFGSQEDPESKSEDSAQEYPTWEYLDELLKGNRDERKAMVAGLFLMFLGAPLFYAQPPYPVIGVASLGFGLILFIAGACVFVLRILKKVGIE